MIYYTSLLMHWDGSSVMFPLGSQWGGLATSDPLTQLALILCQLPSQQVTWVSFTQGKWLQKWLYLWVSLLNFGNSQSELSFFDDCLSFPFKIGKTLKHKWKKKKMYNTKIKLCRNKKNIQYLLWKPLLSWPCGQVFTICLLCWNSFSEEAGLFSY